MKKLLVPMLVVSMIALYSLTGASEVVTNAAGQAWGLENA